MKLLDRARSLLAGLALAIAASVPSLAQERQAEQAGAMPRTPRVAVAPVVPQPPVIDGRLDDEVWHTVSPLSGFIQRELHEGQPVSERTEVRVATDGMALYVAAYLYDRDASGIVPGEKVRDVGLDNSDAFALILDTYLDRQNGFVFGTTPVGVEHDGQVVKEGEGGGLSVSGQTRAMSGSMGGYNLNWDGSWVVATSSDSLGWYAEFRIPFSTLRYGSGSTQTWGVNFARRIRRKNEIAYWSFIPRQFNLYRVSHAGTMEVRQLPTPKLATATPYVLGGSQRNFATMTSAQNTSE